MRMINGRKLKCVIFFHYVWHISTTFSILQFDWDTVCWDVMRSSLLNGSFFPSNYRWNRCIPNMVRSNELKMFDHKFEWDIWNEAVVAMLAMVAMVTASLPLICMNEYVGNLRKTVFDVRIWCDDHLHVFHRLHSFKVFDAEIDGIY